MIGSLNFHVGSLGSVCLSDPIELGSLAGRTTIAATLEASVGSSSEVNSLVSIKPRRGDTVQELRELMKNLNLEETSDSTDIVPAKKSTTYWKMTSSPAAVMTPEILSTHGERDQNYTAMSKRNLTRRQYSTSTSIRCA
jgi:hypothetical protein